MFSKEIFGNRIREERNKRGFSQTALGAEFGVPKQYVSRWENGDVEPNIETLWKLANFFNVSIDYLVGHDDIPNRKEQTHE